MSNLILRLLIVICANPVKAAFDAAAILIFLGLSAFWIWYVVLM